MNFRFEANYFLINLFSSFRRFHSIQCSERFFKLAARQLRQTKLMVSARLDDYLVIDCSFAKEVRSMNEDYYSRLQLKIHSCFTSLYRYHSPSYIILCNLSTNINSRCLYDSPYCHATCRSYLDLFPRKRLVYLSPDSPNTMDSFDHQAIYILGGIFQKSNKII